MRLLVLGGTLFLGRHVAEAARDRGHDVATFTRGITGTPPDGVRDLRGDRDDAGALPAALDGWRPELVVDTSCQTRAAARNAAAAFGDVRGYAFVSSLNAYANWPPGPIGPEDGEPTWQTAPRPPVPANRPAPGLPEDLEAELLSRTVGQGC
jgi:2'-hydroxyisoflavone reductase